MQQWPQAVPHHCLACTTGAGCWAVTSLVSHLKKGSGAHPRPQGLAGMALLESDSSPCTSLASLTSSATQFFSPGTAAGQI